MGQASIMPATSRSDRKYFGSFRRWRNAFASGSEARPTSGEEVIAERYQYIPFADDNSIRILFLLPGEGRDEINCNLFTADLADLKHTYEALSYTWDGLPTERIILDGRSLPVTSNLKAALRRLRHSSETRRLWIDAICVDQENLVERGQQVTSMSQIYSSAEQVLVWLGEAANGSDVLMDAMADIDPTFYLDECTRWHYGGSELPNLAFPLPSKDDLIVHALEYFFERSWFQRIWVRQEVALGRSVKIFCGRKTVSWEHVLAISWANQRELNAGRLTQPKLSRTAELSMLSVTDIHVDRDSFHNGTVQLNLFGLIERARTCHSTEPRDKIYALLSFISDKSAIIGFSPDYTVAVEDLYRNLSKAWLQQGSLQSLRVAGRYWHNLQGLPSWTTDWTNTSAGSIVRNRVWDYDGRLSCRVLQNLPTEVLVICGTTLDSVELLGPEDVYFWPKPDSEVGHQVAQEVLERSMLMFDPSSTYVTGQSALEAFALTLASTSINFVTSETPLKSFEAWKQCMFSGVDNNCWSDIVAAYAEALAHSKVFMENKFCTTTRGFMCVVPPICAQGDVIGIFTGCPVPYVLRRKGDFFELIGHCYVHGFMDGEASARELLKRVEKGQEYGTVDDRPNGVIEMRKAQEIRGVDRGGSSHTAAADNDHESEVGDKDDMPRGWVMEMLQEYPPGQSYFRHDGLQIETDDDPRTSKKAGPVPQGWTSGRDLAPADRPFHEWKAFFVNQVTGDTTFEDPCLPVSGELPEIEGFRII